MEDFRNIKIKSPKGFFWLGNTYCLGYRGYIYLNIGPDWPLNLFMGLILAAINAFFIFVMAPRVVFELKCIGFFIYFGCIVSYSITALKNPGIILTPWELELEEGNKEEKMCKDCDVYTEEGSEHCFECGICIKGYDHHCPLSGKCIGSGNIFAFYSFLAFIFSGLVYFSVWFIITINELGS